MQIRSPKRGTYSWDEARGGPDVKQGLAAGLVVATLLVSCGGGPTDDDERVESSVSDATRENGREEGPSAVLEETGDEEPPDGDPSPECEYLDDMSNQWQSFANNEGAVPPLLPGQADQWLLALGRQDIPGSVIMEHAEIEQRLRRIVKVFDDHPGAVSLNLHESHHQLSGVRRTLVMLENEFVCEVEFAEMVRLPD